LSSNTIKIYNLHLTLKQAYILQKTNFTFFFFTTPKTHYLHQTLKKRAQTLIQPKIQKLKPLPSVKASQKKNISIQFEIDNLMQDSSKAKLMWGTMFPMGVGSNK
jgi:hypothetical protein